MCTTLGFFHLKNIPGFDEDELKRDLREFHDLPDAAKWLLSAGMLLGRLELFTVIVLFTRGFWRG